MSIDSSLVLFRDRLPSRAALAAQLVALGYSVDLRNFDLETSKGRVQVRVDGQKASFDYGLYPLTKEAMGHFPKRTLQVGDVALSFGASGAASIIAVSAIQQAISSLTDAFGLIEHRLVSPKEIQDGGAASVAHFGANDDWGERGLLRERLAQVPQLLPILAFAIAMPAAVFGLICLIIWLTHRGSN